MRKTKRTLGGLGRGMVVMALGLLGGGLGAAPAWAQNCGDTIGPGGIVTLTADVGPCATDPALTVVGPVIFNLNGFTVFCQATTTDGILVQGSRAVVSNGTVTGCENGVQLDGDGHHVITAITSRDNSSDGFEINSSHNNLSFNRARRNDANGFDINFDANNNTLIGNTAEDNEDDGFEVVGDNNVLKLNHAKGNGDDGFLVEPNASNNWLDLNVAWANDGDGFEIGGDNNRITRNVAKQNGDDGIDVQTDATGNLLQGNIALNNNQNGGAFDLEDDNANCDNNTWVNNVFGTASQACIN